jgi:ribonuclease H2 subunit B
VNLPINGTKSLFLLSKTTLFQLQRFDGSLNSWIMGDYIVEDGSMLVATPFDALYILIPALDKQKSRFSELSEILFEFDPDNHDLQKMCTLSLDLSPICDINTVDDQLFFRLNDQKLLDWLRKRVVYLSSQLDSIECFKERKFESDGTFLLLT